MIKRSKLVYVIGSAIIGIVSTICIIVGLALSGVIDASSKKLVFASASKEIIYDGQDLTCNEWEITSGVLKEGHRAEVIVSGKQRGVGSSQNAFSVTILDGNNADVSGDYEIEYVPGMLSVSERPISLLAGSAAKEYDGLPLRENSFETVAGELVEGHVVSAIVTGEITDAGTEENVVTATIRDEAGEDVTKNYAVTTLNGTLTVAARALTLQSPSAQKVYDGTPLEKEEYTIEQGELVAGQSIQATYLSDLVNVGKAENTFSVQIRTEAHTDVTANYDITYVPGTLEIYSKEITIKTGDASKTYDTKPLSSEEWDVVAGAVLSTHTVEVDCYGEITNAGIDTNKASWRIIDEDGNDVSPNYSVTLEEGVLEVTKRSITVQTHSHTWLYDGEVHGEADCACAGGHADEPLYSAETAKYFEEVEHALNLTYVSAVSDYVEGGAENIAEYVIVDARGVEVTSNYAVKMVYGDLEIERLPLKITSEGASKTYDGTPLTREGWNKTEAETYLLRNGAHYHSFADESGCIGTVTRAGETANEVYYVILDENGIDVTHNYQTPSEGAFGKLKIMPRTLYVYTSSDMKVYDGQPLKNPDEGKTEADIYYHGLADGDTLSGLACDISFYTVNERGIRNVPTFTVYNGTENVTDCYAISEEACGLLQIYPIYITVTTTSATKEYDGTPLEKVSGYTFNGELLDASHAFGVEELSDIEYLGSITTPGTVKNTVEDGVFVIRDNYGNGEILDYYKIIVEYGDLKVTKREITVSSRSRTYTYDGTTLYGKENDFSVSSSQQPIGEYSLVVELTGAQTDAGKSANSARVQIYSTTEGKVVDYYEITYEFGALTVNPRPITVQSDSASKVYDGKELTADGFRVVSSKQPLSVHELSVVITGSRTEVGESANTIAEVLVYDKYTGVEVTDNYKITFIEGSLIVKGDLSYGELAENDGGSELGGGAPKGDEVVARVMSDTTGLVYLKRKSEGNYTGQGFNPATEYYECLDGEYSMDYLAGIALENSGETASRLRISVTDAFKGKVGYMLPYYLDNSEFLYNVQTSDVRYAGGTDFEYSMYYFPYDYQNAGFISRVPSAYSDEELDYRNFVEKNYLDLPTKTRSYMERIIASKGWTSSTMGIVGKVARYIQSAATYNLDYDLNMDDESDVVVEFLKTYKEGVCRHYAAAATAMYRALDIPARYTVGYVAKAQAGKYVDVTVKQAHAWVEVYINGSGWVQVEVTGSGNGVTGDVEESPALIVMPTNRSQSVYDGSTLRATNEITGNNHFQKLIDQGYTYSVEVSGVQSGVGKSTSKITSFTLYNPEGLDVTDNYAVETLNGYLHVYRYEVTVTSHGAAATYNGGKLTESGYDYSGLQSGHVMEVKITGAQKNVGSSSNTFDVTIKNRAGTDVTDQYNVVKVFGTLTVTKAQVTLETGSAEAVYETGIRLTCYSYTIIGDMGSNVEDVTFMKGAYQSVIGSCANIATLVIYDGNGTDVTENYEITYHYGTLTVRA